MAANLVGYINLAASNLDTFTNATENDLMIYTSNNTQKVLIGVQSNTAASITVSSNLISFNNNISFGNAITMKGLQIGMSDGTMANISTSSVQGLSNESTGNLQFFVNSNSLSNNFRYFASNTEVVRITGTGNLGLGVTSNIAATVHAYGPNPVSSNISVNSNNLLAWYQYEGNGLDSSGNGYHLSLIGSNLTYIPGQYGDAVWFNNPITGGTYFLTTTVGSNVGIAPPISISFWFNLAYSVQSGQPTMMIYGASNATAGITFNINAGNFLIAGIRTATSANMYTISHGVQSVSPGTWYHVAGTYSGTTYTVYVNGVSVGTPVSVTGNLFPEGIRIGEGNGSTFGFTGSIDDVRIYSRTLSATEVTTLYYATTASNLPTYFNISSGLIGWYQMEGDANDSSPNRYHATISGTPFYVPGKVGNALFFPNTPASTQIHHLDISGYAGLSYQAPISIAVWFNLAAIGADNTIINIGSPASDQGLLITYYNDTNRLTCWIHNGAWTTLANNIATLTTRTWYHFAMTYVSGSCQVYLNGQLMRTVTTVTGNPSNTSALRIGGRLTQNMAFCGSIDDVRVYNRIISPGEVFDLYTLTYQGAGNGNSLITTGSVGVGRVPQYPLDVTGSIRASQDIVTTGSMSATNLGMFRNRIINGNVAIDQRFAGTVLTVSSSAGLQQYFADRWMVWSNRYTTFGVTCQRVADAPASTTFTNSMKYTATAAISGGTNSYILGGQNIEGCNIVDLGFGTNNASPCTLSFWVKSGKQGIFTVTLENNTEDRQLIIPYTVNSSGTWEYKVLSVPPCFTGTWERTTNIGIRVLLLSQSLYTATSDTSWRTIGGAVNYSYNHTSSTSPLLANGDYIQFTGVQFEKGTIATPFEFRPYPIELQLCQRYYEKSFDIETVPATNISSNNIVITTGTTSSATTSGTIFLKVSKRTVNGTVNMFNPFAASTTTLRVPNGGTDVTISSIYQGGHMIQLLMSTTTLYALHAHFTCETEI